MFFLNDNLATENHRVVMHDDCSRALWFSVSLWFSVKLFHTKILPKEINN